MCPLIRFVLIALTICGYVVCQTVITDVGTFIGYVDNVSFNGVQRQVVKYIGIPYAEPTGGENRFAEPKPKQPLSEPYIANRTDLPNICPQLFGGYILAETTDGRMSEDCLHLSIYAPAGTLGSGSRSYPVLLWLHGGSFTVGLSDQYPGDVLSGFNDVILVVINYRLNVFGFFSTGDGTITGNQGLFDQALAIKWVHDHISHFGGNPDDVTLFGGSAGGASVMYQAMYAGNEGYIKRAIIQSAAPMGLANSNMLPFASFAGCNQTTSFDVISCLRAMSWKDLSDKAENPDAGAHFAPVVDGKIIKKGLLEIISDPNSEEMLRFASIDVIFGVNNLEGAMYMLPVYGKVVPGVPKEDLKWISLNVTHEMEISRPLFENTILPYIIMPRLFPSGAPSIVNDAIVSKYSDWTEPNDPKNIRDKVMDLTTDLEFAVNAVKSANAHVQAVATSGSQANTYFYQYSYFSDMFKARPTWLHTGADHADEILSVLGFSNRQALFSKYHVTSYTPTLSDIKMSSLVMNYWAKFATTGNPNQATQPQWPKYTAESREFLRFTSATPSFTSENESLFLEPRFTFWQEIVPALIKSTISKNETQTTKNETRDGLQCLKFSERMNLDSVTAENLIIALAVIAGALLLCLLMFVLVACVINSRRSNSVPIQSSKIV